MDLYTNKLYNSILQRNKQMEDYSVIIDCNNELYKINKRLEKENNHLKYKVLKLEESFDTKIDTNTSFRENYF